MTPCAHDNRVYLHQTAGAYVVWCQTCGASAIDGWPNGYFWRLPERGKRNVATGDPAPTPAPEKPIELELSPSELQTLARWAHTYLATDPRPLVCPETKVAMQVIEAHARFLTAALTGKP